MRRLLDSADDADSLVRAEAKNSMFDWRPTSAPFIVENNRLIFLIHQVFCLHHEITPSLAQSGQHSQNYLRSVGTYEYIFF